MGPHYLLYPQLAALLIPVQNGGESCLGQGPLGAPLQSAEAWRVTEPVPDSPQGIFRVWNVKWLCSGVTQNPEIQGFWRGWPLPGKVSGKMGISMWAGTARVWCGPTAPSQCLGADHVLQRLPSPLSLGDLCLFPRLPHSAPVRDCVHELFAAQHPGPL